MNTEWGQTGHSNTHHYIEIKYSAPFITVGTSKPKELPSFEQLAGGWMGERVWPTQLSFKHNIRMCFFFLAASRSVL